MADRSEAMLEMLSTIVIEASVLAPADTGLGSTIGVNESAESDGRSNGTVVSVLSVNELTNGTVADADGSEMSCVALSEDNTGIS